MRLVAVRHKAGGGDGRLVELTLLRRDGTTADVELARSDADDYPTCRRIIAARDGGAVRRVGPGARKLLRRRRPVAVPHPAAAGRRGGKGGVAMLFRIIMRDARHPDDPTFGEWQECPEPLDPFWSWMVTQPIGPLEVSLQYAEPVAEQSPGGVWVGEPGGPDPQRVSQLREPIEPCPNCGASVRGSLAVAEAPGRPDQTVCLRCLSPRPASVCPLKYYPRKMIEQMCHDRRA